MGDPKRAFWMAIDRGGNIKVFRPTSMFASGNQDGTWRVYIDDEASPHIQASADAIDFRDEEHARLFITSVLDRIKRNVPVVIVLVRQGTVEVCDG